MLIHYLTMEEEATIKRSIQWNSVDRKIRETVRIANQITGLATLQSCEGHVRPTETGFTVSGASVAFRATQQIVMDILFDKAPAHGIRDISIRYFDNGSFWLDVGTEPAERGRLYAMFNEILSERNE